MESSEIKKYLSQKIDPSITNPLVEEYLEVRKKQFYGDIKNTIIHGALFSECSLTALQFLYDGKKIKLNDLNFDKLYNKLLNYSKNTPLEEQITLLIPRVLRSVYTIRSKKKATHMKETLPDELDSEYVISACNWVISQLLIISAGLNSHKVKVLINSLMSRQIPSIEEFEDGDIVILNDKLSFKDEMLLVLYKFSSRLTKEQLISLLKPKNKNYISIYLSSLKTEKLVHVNNAGAILTKKGIDHIESNPGKFID